MSIDDLKAAIEDAIATYRHSPDSDYRAAAALLLRQSAVLVERFEPDDCSGSPRNAGDIADDLLMLPEWWPGIDQGKSIDARKVGICLDFNGLGWGPCEGITLADLHTLARRVA